MVPGFLQTFPGIQAREFKLGFIRPENLVSHGLRVFRCLLANTKLAVVPLAEDQLLSGHYHKGLIWWSAAEMVVLLEDSPSSTEELELCQ
jgi:hypothetical protein